MEFIYKWEDNKEVCNLLTKLYNNTVNYLKELKFDQKYAKQFINDVEEYLFYVKNSVYDLSRVVSKLSGIKFIGFFDATDFEHSKLDDACEIPPMLLSDDAIYLNNKIHGDDKLNDRERMKLYLFSGLTHKAISLQDEKTLEFSRILSDNAFDFRQRKIELIVNNGWLLLENVIAQEIAEHATYTVLSKERPGSRPGLDGEIFPIEDYYVYSNLEMYRMFSEILINFGFSVSKIGELTSHSRERIVYDFTVRAMNENLSDSIISEYVQKNNEIELYKLLYFMGLLVNEKDAVYGMESIHNLRLSLEDTKIIYSAIFEILNSHFNLSNNEYHDIPIPKKNKYISKKRKYILFKSNEM